MLRNRKSSLPPPQGLTEEWDLRLYVAGPTPRSIAAFSNLKRLCEEHLSGHYRIELVDVLDDPRRARYDEVLAVPTVIRRSPGPAKRVIGDLSDAARVLAELSLPVRV